MKREDWQIAVAGCFAGVVLTIAAAASAVEPITSSATAAAPAMPSFSAEEVAFGQKLYQAGCALCHGDTGHGDGEDAKELHMVPPDLTQIAARNHGHFPLQQIVNVLDERQMKRGHRTARFWTPPTESEIHEWIVYLVAYLDSIQANPGDKGR